MPIDQEHLGNADGCCPVDENTRLVAKVAHLYHERGLGESAIAERLNISQARVSRLLRDAAAQGIVRTIVVQPDSLSSDEDG
jgi:DNA-binding transcriptional regulator LsrR (DeoR family)